MNSNHLSLRPVVLAALLTIAPAAAASATVMNFVGTPNPTDTRTDSVQAGFGFYANPSGAAQVNELGFWVAPSDSGDTGHLAVAHTVTLYDYNGTNYTAVAQATVPAGATADANGYAWVNIPAVTLTDTRSGADYYLVTATQGTDTWGPFRGTNTFSGFVDPAFGSVTGNGPFNFNLSPVGVGSTDGFTFEPGNGGYVGPNIGFVVTPEPCSLLLCTLGAAGLLVAARLRRKR
jgi:hypothetical protein